MSETANVAPEEVGINNKYSKHNKLRTILIALLIALVVFGVVYTMSRLLMIYKVTYVTYGGLVYGEEIEDAEYKYLEKTIEPVGLKKEGYYIEGYYLNSNMTNRYEFGTEIKNNIKLYVNWQPGYAVQLNLADGEEEWSNITLEYLKTYYEQYVEPNTQYTLPIITNNIPYSPTDGINHENEQLLWFEDPECTGVPFETKTYTLDRNIPLYGRWFDRGEDKFEISEDGTLQKYLGYCTNIILPSSVKKIKDIAPSEFVSGTSDQLNDQDGTRLSAFQNVLNELEYIYINEECTEIGSCAFRSCENLSNIYFKGNKVTRFGEYSFAFCTSLTSINIPTSVKNIEKRAFYGTTSLKNITGADGVEVIGDDAFINSNLQVVELASVKQIGKMAFSGCYNLKSLILKNSAVVSTNVTETSGDNNNNVLYLSVNAKIYVPSNLINSYKLTFPWNAYSDRILDISELQNV